MKVCIFLQFVALTMTDIYYRIECFFSGIHACVNDDADAITNWINIRIKEVYVVCEYIAFLMTK